MTSSEPPHAVTPEESVVEPAEWGELAQLVAASLPERDADEWLGQVVIEVQEASDRAVAWAESQAASILAEAHADADRIREQGRRRAQLMARFHAVAHRSRVTNGDLVGAKGNLNAPTLAPSMFRWPALSPPTAVAPSPTTDVSLKAPTARAVSPPATPGARADSAARPVLGVTEVPVAPRPRRARAVLETTNGKAPSVPATDTAEAAAARGPVAPTAPPPVQAATPPRRLGQSALGVPNGRRSVAAGAPGSTAPSAPPAVEVPQRQDALRRNSYDGPDTAPTAAVDGTGRPVRNMTAYWRFYAVLLLIVIVASGFTLFERYGTKAQEQRAQQRLTRSFSRQVADVRHPYGGVLGLLTVPRLGLRNVAVVDGASRAALQQGPAHDTASQYPGQQGVVVIVGHHRSYGAPFGQLARLRIGDLVTLQTIAGPLSYRVSRDPQVLSSRLGAPLVLPSPPEVQANGGNPLHAGEALVLATSQGTGSSPLLVVVATLDHTTADAPRSSPTAKVSGILRAVPGDRIGLLWATIWVLVLVGCFRFTRLWRKKLPALAVYPVATCVAVLVTYQLYLALDRVIPGTS